MHHQMESKKKLAFSADACADTRHVAIAIFTVNADGASDASNSEIQLEGFIHNTPVVGVIKSDKEGKYFSFVDATTKTEVADGYVVTRRFNRPTILELYVGETRRKYITNVSSDFDTSPFCRKEAWIDSLVSDESIQSEKQQFRGG